MNYQEMVASLLISLILWMGPWGECNSGLRPPHGPAIHRSFLLFFFIYDWPISKRLWRDMYLLGQFINKKNKKKRETRNVRGPNHKTENEGTYGPRSRFCFLFSLSVNCWTRHILCDSSMALISSYFLFIWWWAMLKSHRMLVALAFPFCFLSSFSLSRTISSLFL